MLNFVLWSRLFYQAEKWTPSTQQDNKLLANERISFWRRPVRKLKERTVSKLHI
jgi:hypothetical protein